MKHEIKRNNELKNDKKNDMIKLVCESRTFQTPYKIVDLANCSCRNPPGNKPWLICFMLPILVILMVGGDMVIHLSQ